VECRGITHDEAIARGLEELHTPEIQGVGHRVVHGGDRFSGSVLIGDEVIRAIEDLSYLAPLHNPVNLAGIRACLHHLPGVPQVAVFDTAFHATVPPEAYTYALPHEIVERWKIRRYGFHGTSHRYLTERFAALHKRTAAEFNLITVHLGNGCSACAVRKGKAVDSTMGMTPLEGLVMGTRPGDLDPAIVYRLLEWENLDVAALDRMLNHKSGLLGLSGVSNDMRELLRLESEGSAGAKIAIDVFCHRIRRYIGAFYGLLNGADAVVFSGGIGENSPEIRARVCRDMDALGIDLDEAANAGCRGREADLSGGAAKCRVWVIPTNEELLIARDTAALIAGD
jgi:acetate kinase